MKNITTEEQFLEKANLVHNNKYTYLTYNKKVKKIGIVCPIHGIFEQNRNAHLAGKACIKCKFLKDTLTQSVFIERCSIKHNFKFDYSKVNYVNLKTKVEIICPEHGSFFQKGDSHINGYGCRKCGSESSRVLISANLCIDQEEWIKRARLKHGDKYDYSLVEYVRGEMKIKIVCPIHGIFEQTAKVHLRCGCLKCGNDYCVFKKDHWIKQGREREGIFYILRCWNDNEEFYKLGITFRSVKERYSYKDGITDYNWEIVKEVKSFDLSYIWDLEKRFKKFKQKQHYEPKIKFGGHKTECFKTKL